MRIWPGRTTRPAIPYATRPRRGGACRNGAAGNSVGGTGLGQFDWRGLEALDRPEDDLVVFDVDDDDLAGAELLVQDPLREGVFDHALDGPAEGPGAERGVVALLGQVHLGRRRELEAEALALQLADDPLHHQVDDR